jgi:hypothetical protein
MAKTARIGIKPNRRVRAKAFQNGAPLAEQRRWEREERERREREAVQALLNEAKAWEDAQRIRRYVEAMKDLAAKLPAWVEWALEVADRLDPAKDKA